jgi:cellobiose phosphorylase
MTKPKIYRFLGDNGTFIVEDPQKYNLYLPLTNKTGSLLSSISPNLAGDIKKDNNHFLTPPASIEDIRSNLLCRREFFIKTEKEVLRLSYSYNDIMEGGILFQKIIKRVDVLHIEILNFIPYDLDVEVMQVRVVNKGDTDFNITPTSFIPLYGRGESNLRDHRHVTSLLNRVELDKYGIYLKPTMAFDEKGHRPNQDIYFVLGYENNGRAPKGQFPTLDYFYGNGYVLNADAIEKNIEPVTKKLAEFDGKEACAAFRFAERLLKSGEEVTYGLVMGIADDKRKIRQIFKKLNSPRKVRGNLEATKKYWQQRLSSLEFDFKDKDYNNWLLWVKLQPTLRQLFGCSFLPHFDYGKGGRGWRDLWQDALALLLTDPDKAKALILNSFKGVRIDGSNATIITKEGDFLADRNRINRVWMDHGVWPYLTTRLYVHRTGDVSLLLEEISYFRDSQLKRSRQLDEEFSGKDYLLRTRSNKVYKGTILEHLLIQNLVQFFNVGEHNIIRLENADWNDGLDMAAQKGESAAFSFMYAGNLDDICVILERLKKKTSVVKILKELAILMDRKNKPVNYNDYKAKQKSLEEYFEKTRRISGEKASVKIDDLIADLKSKSEHLFEHLRKREWLAQGFFSGYYDNQARRVEGKVNGKLRMMLQSQVFAIMSGGATPEQITKIWGSAKKYLQDKKLGGFRLNTDFGSLYLDFGRAFGFSYGDKENGAFFSHMSAMFANALYKRGFIKEGHEVIDSIYKMAIDPRAKIPPGIPEYFNSGGWGLYLYLTGSASWYIYTLLEEVLGVKFNFGKIILEPKLLPENFFDSEIVVKFKAHGKKAKVTFTRDGNKIKAAIK